MIKFINFDTILPIWQSYLWPDRNSKITESSAMVYLGGYDINNMSCTPTFIGYIQDSKIIGVNSGHSCSDGSFRSRGLYVYPEYRGQGIGIKLLEGVIKIAREKKAKFIWSYPKKSSWSTYEKAGFALSSNWENSELGLNAYCVKDLN